MGSESDDFGPTPLIARNIVAGRLIAMSCARPGSIGAVGRDLAGAVPPG